jgi:hypothetical protein
LAWRQGESQSRSWSFGEEKTFLSLPEIKPWVLNHPAHSLVTTPAEQVHMFFFTFIYCKTNIFTCL